MKREILSIEHLDFSYNNKQILTDVNLKIYENDFIGLIGPNGGGKTTLIKLILGLLSPTKGKIKLFGKNPFKSRIKVGYLSQFSDVDFDFPITAKEVVLLSKIKNVFTKYTKKDIVEVERVMDRLGIKHLENRNLNELSGGEKQRVFVARALASNPKLLILDEPMANVDIHHQESFYDFLKEINKELTIIVVEHNIELLVKYVDDVVCINKCYLHGAKYHPVDKIHKRLLNVNN